MSNERHSPAGAGEHVQRMLQDWYYAPRGADGGGTTGWTQLPEGVIPFELKADATAPGTPTAYTAYRLAIDSSGKYNIPLDGSDPDEAFAIYVFDLTGEISAPGYTTRHAMEPPQDGARGWCVRSDPNADEPAGNAPAYSILWMGGAPRWGEVTGDDEITNIPGGGSLPVQIHPCNWDGTEIDAATTLTVYTPIRNNKATALYLNYIVSFAPTATGELVVTSDCFDDALNTIKAFFGDTADIPDGWQEWEPGVNRFLVGVGGGSNGDEGDIGAMGGFDNHGSDSYKDTYTTDSPSGDNNHDNHTPPDLSSTNASFTGLALPTLNLNGVWPTPKVTAQPTLTGTASITGSPALSGSITLSGAPGIGTLAVSGTPGVSGLSITGAPGVGSLSVSGAPDAGTLALAGGVFPTLTAVTYTALSGVGTSIIQSICYSGGSFPTLTGVPGIGSLAIGGAPSVGSLAISGTLDSSGLSLTGAPSLGSLNLSGDAGVNAGTLGVDTSLMGISNVTVALDGGTWPTLNLGSTGLFTPGCVTLRTCVTDFWHDKTDNRPPFVAVRWILRVSGKN